MLTLETSINITSKKVDLNLKRLRPCSKKILKTTNLSFGPQKQDWPPLSLNYLRSIRLEKKRRKIAAIMTANKAIGLKKALFWPQKSIL